MDTTIGDYWLENKQYWIAIGPTRAIADREICDRFYNYDYSKSDNFSKVVFLDQFLRHFSRVMPGISEIDIKAARAEAAAITDSTDLTNVSEEMLIWYLMPWKHLEMWDKLFTVISERTNGGGMGGMGGVLSRFFMDSYIKAYTDQRVAEKLVVIKGETEVKAKVKAKIEDNMAICESYPVEYQCPNWTVTPYESQLTKELQIISEPVAVSLSGGVDSMVLTALLKDRVAIHIVYGNRKESPLELEFIKEYTAKLGVTLYVYTIEWLKRDQVDRAFYERMTRSIRFSVYKAVGMPVVLGHIQDDVVENIWTNLAKGTNLDDLAKLRHVSSESKVKIYRPWLDVKKSLIYEAAGQLAIPHLKNTTPEWSNRGKFRTEFHEAVIKQYGLEVDQKIIEVARRFKKQSDLLDQLLVKPILDSWDDETGQINITGGIDVLDEDGWLKIFTTICHHRLGLNKPSWAACHEFCKRTLRPGMKINMSKDLQFKVITRSLASGDQEIWLRRITS